MAPVQGLVLLVLRNASVLHAASTDAAAKGRITRIRARASTRRTQDAPLEHRRKLEARLYAEAPLL